MSAIDPVAAVEALSEAAKAAQVQPLAQPVQSTRADAPDSVSFADMIANGIDHVEGRVDHADAMVRAFALDGSVPVHQVTIALEQARMSVELAVQMRTRFVEAYRSIMGMQL